jgi:cobalt-zinc-cadmium efflux system outer membrane protein
LRTLVLIWAAAALCLPRPPAEARAQALLTEAEFLAHLTPEHPALGALGHAVAAAQAELSRARLLANPRAEFEHESPGDEVNQTTWTLSWTPPLDTGRGAAIRAAEAGVAAAQARLRSQQLQLRLQLRAAFATWALAEERARVLESHLQALGTLARQLDARAQAGEASGLAAGLMALAASGVRSGHAQAVAEAARAAAAARGWLIDPSVAVSAMSVGASAASTHPVIPSLPEIDGPIDIEQRPDLAAQEHDVEQAQWSSRSAGSFLQFPELGVGWQRQEDGSASTSGPVFAASWVVPLFDRRQPEQAEGRARQEAAAARLRLERAAAVQQLEGALTAYAVLREQAESARAGPDVAARLIEASAARLSLGESGVTEVLETLRTVLESRLAALDLHAAAAAAHRDIEAAAGRPLALSEGD